VDTGYDKYGQRCQLTVSGGSKRNLLRITDQVLEVIKGREHKFMYLEPSNEGNVSKDVVIQMVKKLMTSGLLVAPGFGNDYGGIMKELMLAHIGNMVSPHLARTASDFDWRFVRQTWDVRDYKVPTSQGEPKGPLSSVSWCSDPLRLAMARAVGILNGAGSYCLHNGAGVYGVEKSFAGGVRPPNIWETPDIDNIMTAIRGIDTLMPIGVEDWVRANDAWTVPAHPLRSQHFWEGKSGYGVNKNYSASFGASFVTAPCGVMSQEGKDPYVTARNACRVVVSDPLNPGTPIEIKDLGAGEELVLKGTPNAQTAYIINGIRL